MRLGSPPLLLTERWLLWPRTWAGREEGTEEESLQVALSVADGPGTCDLQDLSVGWRCRVLISGSWRKEEAVRREHSPTRKVERRRKPGRELPSQVLQLEVNTEEGVTVWPS